MLSDCQVLFITDNAVLSFWECRDFGKSSEHVRRHFELSHFLFWLKLSELIETVIFVLRKKQNQVSKLHIFHHFSTVTLVYVLMHFNENGERIQRPYLYVNLQLIHPQAPPLTSASSSTRLSTSACTRTTSWRRWPTRTPCGP